MRTVCNSRVKWESGYIGQVLWWVISKPDRLEASWRFLMNLLTDLISFRPHAGPRAAATSWPSSTTIGHRVPGIPTRHRSLRRRAWILRRRFSLNRMSWIKPNFLWMMYRCGWATKADQEVVLAVRMKRSAFDEILRRAVHSSFVSEVSKRVGLEGGGGRSEVGSSWTRITILPGLPLNGVRSSSDCEVRFWPSMPGNGSSPSRMSANLCGNRV